MADAIYGLLAGLGQEGILWAVAGLLFALFVLGLLFEKFRQAAPALMTNLGILGTFCGIFIALHPLDFSPERINASIEQLLNGMTTAFVTSLLGIASAVVFRVAGVPLSISLEGLLSRFIQTPPPPAPREQREILDRLDDIRKAIAGDGDSSIVTQMQKLRDENSDGFKKLDGLSETIRGALVENLEGLANDIREVIGRQLGESLQALIRNIEEALIRQFGETFVQFNEATQALRKWQEDHRVQVEQLTAAFNLAAERIALIAAECEKIPPTMERLREIIETARRDVESLNRQLEAFASLRQQAESAFPAIKSHLDRIGDDLASSARGFDGLEKTIQAAFRNVEQESRRAAEQHAKSMGEMSEGMRATLQAAEQGTRQIAEQHARNVEQIAAGMREALQNAQSDSAGKVTEVVNVAIQHFSDEMNREIDRVARAWGGNLVSIAEKAQQAINAAERGRQ